MASATTVLLFALAVLGLVKVHRLALAALHSGVFLGARLDLEPAGSVDLALGQTAGFLGVAVDERVKRLRVLG